jgi:hypothetical protein
MTINKTSDDKQQMLKKSEQDAKHQSQAEQIEFEQQAECDEIDQDFAALSNHYQQQATEEPADYLDKQILAAAAREIEQPNPKAKIKYSWWRKLSLPLYAMSIFGFTALAAHWYWPAPIWGGGPAWLSEQNNSNKPLSSEPIKIDSSAESNDELNPEASQIVVRSRANAKAKKMQRQQIQIAAEEKLKQSAQTPKTESPVVDASLSKKSEILDQEVISLQLSDDLKQQASKAQNFSLVIEEPVVKNNADKAEPDQQKESSSQAESESTANQMPLEPHLWAEKIIDLVRLGDHQAAQVELVEFKKQYPEYPIDEQIKSLL